MLENTLTHSEFLQCVKGSTEDEFRDAIELGPVETPTKPIRAPIVEEDPSEDDDIPNSFVPGRIVAGIINPLTKFRDSVWNIFPVKSRPVTRQAAPMEYLKTCSQHSGLQCADCNTLLVSVKLRRGS